MCWDRIIEAEEPARKTQDRPKAKPVALRPENVSKKPQQREFQPEFVRAS